MDARRLPLDRQHNFVMVLLELQHNLDICQLVKHTKIQGCARADEIEGVSTVGHPRPNIFEVKTAFFLLKKYSHT